MELVEMIGRSEILSPTSSRLKTLILSDTFGDRGLEMILSISPNHLSRAVLSGESHEF